MPTKILLTTTSYQDTPGKHHDLLNRQGWKVVTARGPLTEQQMLDLVGDFDGIICGDDEITAAVIDKSLPRLKWISKYGIGLDKIDSEYLTTKSIPLGFTPGVNHTTVAEHAFGLLIAVTKKIAHISRETRAGRWTRITGNEILGKTLGIIGLGRIGQEIVKRANAFGLDCTAYDVVWNEAFAEENGVQRIENVDDLIAGADIISLNCPLTDATRHLIKRHSIETMKDGVVIVNCARGELINVDDVVAGLESGKIGGFATDVLEKEPPSTDHPLLKAPNTVITSHVASRTSESVHRQATMATQNAINFVEGVEPLAQANSRSDNRIAGSTDTYFVVPVEKHNALVQAAYLCRGYTKLESEQAAKFCELASTHGIRTHNALKALHLDNLLGSQIGGCIPNAEIKKLECRFEASEIWDAQLKLGQSVAFEAMDRAMELADKYGIGQVSVDNCFHYLWGGGYVMQAAKKGYIAYTNCTSALAEVVPFQGKSPTLGTNPHSWAFPTVDAIGFPIVIDWATSTVAMGRVQQLKREGKQLPPNAAVDADGKPTTNPENAVSLVPFGAHKGYGLSLINELVAAFIGGSLPTLRGRPKPDSEKSSANFYFQVIHPDSMNSGLFARGRTQNENIKSVLKCILDDGNENCLWPGEMEANAATKTAKAGGLLFTEAEIAAFNEIAKDNGSDVWDKREFATFPV